MTSRSPLAVLVSGALLMLASVAGAQVPLLDGMGGPRSYGTDCLSPNDDGSSAQIDITSAFPSGLKFFDRTHTSVYVNTNGNITFSESLSQYTPESFPVADQPMIAPYWADVDIRGDDGAGGCAFSSGGGASGCRNPTENGVWWHLEPGRLVVTWHEVGYFSCHDDLKMNFQLILTEAPGCDSEGDFNVEFRYNRCEWTTGDASGGSAGFGGTPGQAGFDAGNLQDFVEIMGSRTANIHTTLCTGSNVGEPGVWRFQLRSGAVICPDVGEACDTGGVGACGEGRMQCIGSGAECVQIVEPSPERCDAVDNDCNGMTDEGEGLCAENEQCIQGRCIQPCFEGGCPEGFTCSAENGVCIEMGCENVTCEAGLSCRGGTCVDACEGVTCPLGQSCIGGRCLDVCGSITCDDCTVCQDGQCVPRCEAGTCGSGKFCDETGLCREAACDGVQCEEGWACVAGLCQDKCQNAVCPTGEVCMAGECRIMMTVEPSIDAGAGDAAVADAGIGEPDAAFGAPVDPSSLSYGRRKGGCSAAAGPEPELAIYGLALLAMLAHRRRRRA